MADIGKLAMLMSVNPGSFHKELDAATAHVKSFAGVVGQVSGGGAASFAAVLPGQLGMVAGAAMAVGAAFSEAMQKGIAFTAEVTSLGRRYGLAAEQASTLAVAARLAGVDNESLGAALNHMNLALGHAIQGSAEAQRAFAQLGFRASELSGMSADQALAQIGERLNLVGDRAERTAIAQAIFGRGWQEIDGILTKGTGSLSAAEQAMQRFGIAVTEADQAALRSYTRSAREADLATTALSQKISSTVLPIWQEMKRATTSFVGSLDWGDLIKPFSALEKAATAIRGTQGVREETQRFSPEELEAQRQQIDLENQLAKAREDAQKVTGKWEEQAQALSSTGRQAEIYRSALAGVDEETLVWMTLADQQLTKLEERAKLEREVTSLLHQQGKASIKGPAAAEQGSAAAFTAVNRAIDQSRADGGDPQARVEAAINQAKEVARLQLLEQRRVREALERIEPIGIPPR